MPKITETPALNKEANDSEGFSEKAEIPRKTRKAAAKVKPGKNGHLVIAAMGASAGGLQAIEAFFSHMPADSGIGFVVISHQKPDTQSMLPELMKKHTRMPVEIARDGMEVKPDRIYINPPGKDMGILEGRLQILDTTGDVPHLPVNYFFRSLAMDRGENAAGIILSGMGTDGTLGLQAIKAELGLIMVQDPETARYDGMPGSALETGLADFVLAPEEMPEKLLHYIDHSRLTIKAGPPAVSGGGTDKVLMLLRSATTHDFTGYKKSTINRRILRRMNLHAITEIDHYVQFTQQNPQELQTLFKELLIGVTSFFRDPEAFEALKENALLAGLKEIQDGQGFRAWVPGCATGEEAYSIAILVAECMTELRKRFEIQIFATDIDENAIAKARTGVYPAGISADVGKRRLDRFFTQEEQNYRVRKEIREMVIFAPQSVIRHPPFTRLDLLSCRNLLIYLGGKLQKKLIPLFHYALKPDGVLFLGSSEGTGTFDDLFSPVDHKWKIYRRRPSAYTVHPLAEFPLAGRTSMEEELPALRTPAQDVVKRFEKYLLRSATPPIVITDEKGDIVYIHGRTGSYLEPSPGAGKRNNIMEMAREGLRLFLPSMIHKALSREHGIQKKMLKIKTNGEHKLVRVTVQPMDGEEGIQGLLAVIFEDAFEPEPAEKADGSPEPGDLRVTELERQLRDTRENLQTTIEELETANEELRATNEEYQSTNEELQSANEEMETSREELQSLNEELMSVNNELKDKIEESSRAYGDLQNLLNGLNIPTLFLDNQLRIRRFSSYIDRIVKVRDTDVGRPVADLAFNLQYGEMQRDARKVLETLMHIEKEVETTDGHWYLMRILPFRANKDTLEGVVVTFVDIDDLKETGEKLKAARQDLLYLDNIVSTLREPFLVLDENLKVVSANRAFYETFRVTPRETQARHIYDLGNRQWDIPRLRTLLEQILPEKSVLHDFLVEHDFHDIGRKKMMLNARRISSQTTAAEQILLAFEEVTEKSACADGEQGKKS
jgi:two-component system CheB/CheR fusion protein